MAKHSESLGALWQQWLQGEGPRWIFIAKTLLASFFAFWLSIQLDFDKPATAMMTVFIVAQPQSGLVVAKGFYRIIGTLVGLVITWLLLASFAQQQELFILCQALWIGLCVAGAARFREFQAYAFLLAGYTSCLIGFPAVMQPENFFSIAQGRISEIILGILCAAIISDTLFPQRLTPRLVAAVRGQFAGLLHFVHEAVAAPLDRTITVEDQLRFVSQILALETLRASTIFETPDSRIRDDRLRLFNADFMTVTTSLHALQQHAWRMREQKRASALAALRPCVAEIAPQLTREDGSIPAMAAEAPEVATRLQAFLPKLENDLAASREILQEKVSAQELLEFDCAAELLRDVVSELMQLTQSYAALAVSAHSTDRVAPTFIPHTEASEAIIAGVRATAAMLAVLVFWITTGWSNGATAATLACIGCALFAASPAPLAAVKQMSSGFVLGFIAAVFCKFLLLPEADNFIMMCLAFLPFLLAGSLIMTNPRYPGVGAGFNLMLISAIAPDNQMVYDMATFLNDGMAQLVGIGVAGVAFLLLAVKPVSALQLRLARHLRHELARTTSDSLRQLPHSFESRTRDLIRRISTLPEPSRSTLTLCALSVLELGDATVDLRRSLPQAGNASLQKSLTALLELLATAFRRSDADSRRAAIKALQESLRELTELLASEEKPELLPLQRQLYRIYSVLCDEAWFAAFSQRESGTEKLEVSHAS
ncbi:MAG: FUSC family protein [Pedobacter sp.]|nr:FUSC family protein [Pedobacter sp.]